MLSEVSDRAACPPRTLAVAEPDGLPPGLAELPFGAVDARAGAAARRCIEQAVAWMRQGAGRAIVTAPIHKESFAAAGAPWPGHTEMLQELASEPGCAASGRAHDAGQRRTARRAGDDPSLAAASDRRARPAGIAETLAIAHAAGLRFGIHAPRIAVAGLNPHAGEGGLFGDEEIRLIAPAIARARAAGIAASGPFAPDTVFMRARDAAGHPGEFDFVVAMTHDHGLIPVKYLGVEQGVNVTLGLPFVQTQPRSRHRIRHRGARHRGPGEPAVGGRDGSSADALTPRRMCAP